MGWREMEEWLRTHKPGQEGGAWPEALKWPANMTKNVKTVATRWQNQTQKTRAPAVRGDVLDAPSAEDNHAPSAPGGSA